MRLIGGKDYYDNALMYGRDETLTFVRDRSFYSQYDLKDMSLKRINPQWYFFDKSITKEYKRLNQDIISRRFGYNDIRFKDMRHFNSCSMVIDGLAIWFTPIPVYFAGKVYKGIHISYYGASNILEKKHMKVTDESFQKHTFIWNEKGIQNYLKFINETFDRDIYIDAYRLNTFTGREFISPADYFATRDFTDSEIDDFVRNNWSIAQYVNGVYSDLINWNIINHTEDASEKAVQGHRMGWLVDSDTLRHIEFYKAVDAYTAMQELSMWVGGYLVSNGNPMIDLSDKDRITKHGFDKWSFRRHKDDVK